MTEGAGRANPGPIEFIVLMALMVSLVALSIDAMLPALGEIGTDLGVARDNDTQWVVTALFLGLAVAQLLYGPLSDSIGRKPAIYLGMAVFVVGCLLSIFATNFTVMLAGRVLQGIGAAGPRIVTVALVRDGYEGQAMARIMSFVMAVFILVPALAPILGQGILMVAHWRGIFVCFLALAVFASTWFAIRQPETLAPDKRVGFSFKQTASAIVETGTNRTAFGYMLAAGLIFGAFVGYLNSVQQIFQVQYGLGAAFPFYFAVLALSIGCASFLNARLVMRHGMRVLSRWALQALSILSVVFLVAAVWQAGHPPLWTLMGYCLLSFFCLGILFGNFNALAMEPLGHIAGTGAAVVGSLTTFLSLVFGLMIGQAYDGTVLPLIGGFAVLGVAALLVMAWTERGRKFSQ